MVLLASCKTPQWSREVTAGQGTRASVSGELIDTAPRGDRLVFLGVANILSRRQESIDLALADAARRVAIFHGVHGEYTIISRLGGGLLDYRAEASGSLNYQQEHTHYLDLLEFDEDEDVFVSENAVFVRVRYSGSLQLDYRISGPGRPYWIDNPPEMIDAYHVGLGYADRRGAHRDTVTASYENAIFSIIRSLYSVSRQHTIDYRGAGFLDIAAVSGYDIDAQGSLNGFYVLETWTDPQSKAVWTLAIAGKPVFEY